MNFSLRISFHTIFMDDMTSSIPLQKALICNGLPCFVHVEHIPWLPSNGSTTMKRTIPAAKPNPAKANADLFI